MPICAYCDGDFIKLTKDHVVPKSLGVNFGAKNIVQACWPCNVIKGKMAPATMRIHAGELERTARALRQIADRAEAIMAERGLVIPDFSAKPGDLG